MKNWKKWLIAISVIVVVVVGVIYGPKTYNFAYKVGTVFNGKLNEINYAVHDGVEYTALGKKLNDIQLSLDSIKHPEKYSPVDPAKTEPAKTEPAKTTPPIWNPFTKKK